MSRLLLASALTIAACATWSVTPAAAQSPCIDCHANETPGTVADWKISRHGEMGLDCSVCHGTHTSAADVADLRPVTPETCGTCHADCVDQFSAGKHAMAWAAYKAMPTTHALPMEVAEGMKGCGGCHKIGLKSEDEMAALKAAGEGFGLASCDACHTRHTFSAKEARQPQACQTCHMGFDHPQWHMYSSSKHGVRFLLKQNGTLPESAAAPTCQTCHMPEGDHEVRTAWGFLLISICSQCHSEDFARGELEKGDEMIRQVDHLLAEAIRVIARLYEDGTLEKPESYASAFPDLLTFPDAPTVIEQRLFEMHLKHRMRAFQGAFHQNPDYALWYGWSEMVRDLSEIEEMAADMRRAKTAGDR